MNILYLSKERQKCGEKTALKYNPPSQLLLGCSDPLPAFLKNNSARKLELLFLQNRYIGHKGGIVKIKGNPIFFLKVLVYLMS